MRFSGICGQRTYHVCLSITDNVKVIAWSFDLSTCSLKSNCYGLISRGSTETWKTSIDLHREIGTWTLTLGSGGLMESKICDSHVIKIMVLAGGLKSWGLGSLRVGPLVPKRGQLSISRCNTSFTSSTFTVNLPVLPFLFHHHQ